MSDAARKFFTVVYQIKDKEAFQAYLEKTTALLSSGDQDSGATVTGCGFGDSMTEADAYRDCVIEQGLEPYEVLEDFIDHSGIDPVDGMPMDDYLSAILG